MESGDLCSFRERRRVRRDADGASEIPENFALDGQVVAVIERQRGSSDLQPFVRKGRPTL